MKLNDDQVNSIVVLIDREIAENVAAGDSAYNSHWENIKKILTPEQK